MKVPPNIDKYTHNINDMIYDLKVTDNKGIELPLVGNGESKKVLSQFNDTNRNIKLQKDRDEVQTQFQTKFVSMWVSISIIQQLDKLLLQLVDIKLENSLKDKKFSLL